MNYKDSGMTDSQKWMVLAGILLTGWLIYLLSPILTPFVAAAGLAYLTDPIVDRLERWNLSRTLGVVVVFVLMSVVLALVLLIAVPALESQIERFISRLPRYGEWLRDMALPWLEERLNLTADTLALERLVALLREHWQKAGGLAAQAAGYLTQGGLAVVTWAINLTLIPVVTFYLLRDWDKLIASIHDLIPRRWRDTAAYLAREMDGVLGAFIRGQLLVMLALGLIYAIGLWLVGIDLAFLIGLVAGLLSFVPYLGTALGLLMAVIAALVQYQDWLHVLLVLGVFGIGQALEGMVLTPWLVGDRIGLHPVAVIFAVLAGGQLFGFIGVLLALPVAAALMVLVRYAHRRYKSSRVYGDGPAGGAVAADQLTLDDMAVEPADGPVGDSGGDSGDDSVGDSGDDNESAIRGEDNDQNKPREES